MLGTITIGCPTGRAIVVVCATRGVGPITLTATAPGLRPATVTIRAQRAPARDELR